MIISYTCIYIYIGPKRVNEGGIVNLHFRGITVISSSTSLVKKGRFPSLKSSNRYSIRILIKIFYRE